MTQLLIVIVNKNDAKKVVKIANDAGAKGGTILRGKGASVFEKKGFLGLNIEPEKDIVMILSDSQTIKNIKAGVDQEFNLKKPNSGIAFVLNIDHVKGLVT